MCLEDQKYQYFRTNHFSFAKLSHIPTPKLKSATSEGAEAEISYTTTKLCQMIIA